MNEFIQHFLMPVLPPLCLVLTALLLISVECAGKPLRTLKFSIAVLGHVIAIAAVIYMRHNGFYTGFLPAEASSWISSFQSHYRVDNLTISFYLIAGLLSLIGTVFVRYEYDSESTPTELYFLLTSVTLGVFFLISANSLLVLFLALELMSLPTYVLVGSRQNSLASSEGALKYFLFGSLATVFLVLGITFLYANFGTFHLPELASRLYAYSKYGEVQPSLQGFALAGLALTTIAASFKVGAVPFHMWVPDAYQGAPTSITGYMGSVVKLAGFALILRLLWGVFLPLQEYWIQTVSVLAALSMVIGNLGALRQTNLKRLFAYSSIAHAGYILINVASVFSGSEPNTWSLLYYLIVYGLMFLGVFCILSLLERSGSSLEIYDLSGMGYTHPLLSAALTLFVLSGAGIPPTAGFFAKYFVFVEAVRNGHLWLVLVGIATSLIGAYYYLRVLVYLYMKESLQELRLPAQHPIAVASLFFCAASMVGFSLLM